MPVTLDKGQPIDPRDPKIEEKQQKIWDDIEKQVAKARAEAPEKKEKS